MKILAFGASLSSKSINKKLATYAASLLNGHDVEVLDLRDYELPLFSDDREVELGQPQLAKDFLAKIGESDAVIISFAEHNKGLSAGYKSLFDWCSRINGKVFQGKPMVFLATSPGGRGAATVLEFAASTAHFFDGDVRATVSIPKFHDNFDDATGAITNLAMQKELQEAVKKLLP